MFATPEAPVAITVPADQSFVRIVRLVVSSLAADLAFDFEEVEDLRIAADELLSALIAATEPNLPVSVVLTSSGGVLELRASAPTAGGPAVELDPLAEHIVSAVVESFQVVGGDVATVAFRSRRPGATRVDA